ncbi:hypothetical protein Tco_0905220 [Tanacetum coccineum]
MTITRSGMTPEAIEELVNRRMEEALAAHAANALEAENESQNGNDDDNGNGSNRNGDNGNGGNGNPNENGRDVPSTSDRRLIELKNQVQRLMEAHLAPKSYVQVNKIASSREICSSPHNTQYCMENLEQAFVDYASSHSNEVGGASMARVSTISTGHHEKDAPRRRVKGLKVFVGNFTYEYDFVVLEDTASVIEIRKRDWACL